MENIQNENITNIDSPMQNNEGGMDLNQKNETCVNVKRKRIDKLLDKGDIKYRGVFSSRAMKVLGFVLLFLAQVYMCVKIIDKFVEIPQSALDIAEVLEILSYYALPMFLAANFCIILTSKTKIKKMLINYSIIAFGIYLLVLFGFYRYMLGIGRAISDDPASAYALADLLSKKLFGRVINYNVFVDLSLFSLFYFFLFYTPKKLSKKSSIITFRMFSIVPILIAILSAVLYGLYSMGIIDLPVAILAILPCRSLTVYAIFFSIALIVKLRQSLFIKWGGTMEEYERYSLSNRSSLEISIVSAIVMIVICLLDLIILFVYPFSLFFGIGVNFYLGLSAPLLLLLSYTRKTKPSIWDAIMVALFIFAVIILYLETGLYIINNIN